MQGSGCQWYWSVHLSVWQAWDNAQTASTEDPEHNLEGQPPIIVLHSGVVKKVVYTEYRHTSKLLMPAAPRGQA